MTQSEGRGRHHWGRDVWALKGQAARQGSQPHGPALGSGVDHKHSSASASSTTLATALGHLAP